LGGPGVGLALSSALALGAGLIKALGARLASELGLTVGTGLALKEGDAEIVGCKAGAQPASKLARTSNRPALPANERSRGLPTYMALFP
jgi:hypothetical protein